MTSCLFIYQVYYISPMGFSDVTLMNDLLNPLLFSFFTIVGIISRIIYNNIDNHKSKKINILKILKESLEKKEIWLAILVSPIIIASFYTALSQIDNLMLLSLMSYENGFFFKTIFEKKDIDHEG